MFSNVMVAVDGGFGGRDAVALATRLVGEGGAITLAHVHPGEGFASHASNLEFDAVERQDSQSLLEQERASAGGEAQLASIAASTVGEGLHLLAENHHADLLVIGSHRHSRSGRVRVRDDTRAALNGASCPVAVAPWAYARSGDGIAVVGVAYDGSSDSEAALTAARELTATRDAAIRALTVVPIPDPYEHPQPTTAGESPDADLDAAQARLDALEGVEGRAVYGVAAEELAAFGAEVDLLVIGSRGFGPIKRLIFGSTSDELSRTARCPLLVLARSEHGAEPVDPRAGEEVGSASA